MGLEERIEKLEADLMLEQRRSVYLLGLIESMVRSFHTANMPDMAKLLAAHALKAGDLKP